MPRNNPFTPGAPVRVVAARTGKLLGYAVVGKLTGGGAGNFSLKGAQYVPGLQHLVLTPVWRLTHNGDMVWEAYDLTQGRKPVLRLEPAAPAAARAEATPAVPGRRAPWYLWLGGLGWLVACLVAIAWWTF